MPAAQLDVKLKTSEDFYLKLRWLDSEEFAINIGGYRAFMRIRQSFNGLVIHDASTDNGEIVMDASESFIVIRIPNATAGRFPPGNFFYELVVISPANRRTSLLEGALTIEAGPANERNYLYRMKTNDGSLV